METKIVQSFAIKLLGLVPISDGARKFLDKDKLMLELFSRTNKFAEEYSAANPDEGIEIYAEYETDIKEILTLDYSLHGDNSEMISEALGEFIDENRLDKSDELE